MLRLRYRKVPNVELEGEEEVAKEMINDLLNNDYKIYFLPSGNSAIFLIVSLFNNFTVPDVGGWKKFVDFCKILNKNFEFLKTEHGLVREVKGKYLYLTTLSGYLAKQDMKRIKKECEEKNIFLIEDLSGAIGGDCGYGDIIVGSTGEPKILNCGYGGFIGISEELSIKVDDIVKSFKTKNYFGLLIEELMNAKRCYRAYVKANYKMKKNIESSFFKDREGISLFIKHDKPKELAKKINSAIKLTKRKSLTTICPNYNRIDVKGVVFETKKIDYRELNNKVVKEITKEITNIIKSLL
ncbi:conserved hypothetical protein [Methanocaldococcus infernus ME]|uniref:DegT/DnrJ/EryC1/StrS aminotransferase n=1 Tax=Methanocaldococcus infernus (strain DSM 11812 / JCM 15783 / ME) TaxID=573063 RepID=D5VT73_METIM|nr:hypothetical protein [Methanocaldococcus infernus]ADG13776.1 conserved hypothetical protein [Methanocaldococcus infernus ME]